MSAFIKLHAKSAVHLVNEVAIGVRDTIQGNNTNQISKNCVYPFSVTLFTRLSQAGVIAAIVFLAFQHLTASFLAVVLTLAAKYAQRQITQQINENYRQQDRGDNIAQQMDDLLRHGQQQRADFDREKSSINLSHSQKVTEIMRESRDTETQLREEHGKKLAEIEAQKKLIQEQLEIKKQELEAARKASEEFTAGLARETQTLRAENIDFKQKQEQQLKTIADLEAHKKQLDDQIAAARKENEGLKAQIESLTHVTNGIAKEARGELDKNTELEKQLKQVEELKALNHTKDAELKEIRAEFTAQLERISYLEEQLKEIQAQKGELESQNNSLQLKNQKMSEIDIANSELQNKLKEADKAMKLIEEELKRKTEELEKARKMKSSFDAVINKIYNDTCDSANDTLALHGIKNKKLLEQFAGINKEDNKVDTLMRKLAAVIAFLEGVAKASHQKPNGVT